MLVYMLGHRPDEFGLVPDSEGFIPYKELLQAIHEEEGWRYVRRSHINEVLFGGGIDRSLNLRMNVSGQRNSGGNWISILLPGLSLKSSLRQ